VNETKSLSSWSCTLDEEIEAPEDMYLSERFDQPVDKGSGTLRSDFKTSVFNSKPHCPSEDSPTLQALRMLKARAMLTLKYTHSNY
jgi:hypothetical protein